MSSLRKIAHNIFVWSYERGTIQYDIICALILAFIFLVPPSCFVAQKSGKASSIHQEIPGAHSGAQTDLRR